MPVETALISAGVSAVVSLAVSYLTRRSQNRAAIDTKLLKSIELAMSYPHVEDDDYCREWDKSPAPPPPGASVEVLEKYEKERDKRVQYEMYCCYVFNLIEDIWRHCLRESHIKQIVHVEEFVESHRCWWEKQDGNLTGYDDKKFRAYIQGLLDDIKRKEKGL